MLNRIFISISGYRFAFLWQFMIVATLSAQSVLWPEKVDAFVEYRHVTFEVTGPNSGIQKVKGMIHVFNSKGQGYGRVSVHENKMRECKSLNIRLLDLNNKELRKLKKSEIEIDPITNNISLYDDSRYKTGILTAASYPYKVQFSYEVEVKSLIYWPDWYPEGNIPVLNTSYTLKLNHPTEFKYKSKSGMIPDSTLSGGNKRYTWQLSMIPPLNDERVFLAPEDKYKYELLFAPKYFQTGGISGSNESWDSFAGWYRRLLVGRDHLPVTVRNEIKGRIKPEDTKRDIIQKVYKYLQDNTRYVAIYLGIGGWQPHSVASVYQNKYGDCKDLSIFAISMLKSFDIPAYPALILTRDEGLTNPDFPANDFNHLIAFVPLEEDTLWLECTSDNLAAGQLHDDIEGCNVLVVKDDSGEIITTPESSAEDNLWESFLTGKLAANGSLRFNGTLAVSNNQSSYYRGNLAYADETARIELVRGIAGSHLPKVNIEKFTIENADSNYSAPLHVSFKANASNAASSNGSRIFVNPNLINRLGKRSRLKNKDRDYPIHRSYAYRDIDSVALALPLGYKLEGAPKEVSLETDYTRYQTQWTVEDDSLHYRRLFEIKKRQIPAEAYEEHRTFMKQVRRNDNSQFVFKRGI